MSNTKPASEDSCGTTIEPLREILERGFGILDLSWSLITNALQRN